MHLRKHTISFLPEQPGWCGNSGIRTSVVNRTNQKSLVINKRIIDSNAMCLLVTNEQYKSYASDLDMT